MLLTPALVTLPPTDYVLKLRPYLQVAMALQVLVGIGRIVCHGNIFGAIQFFALAALGSSVMRRRFDINWVIPYLVLSMMTFMLDLLMLTSATFSQKHLDQRLLADRFDVHLGDKALTQGQTISNIWDLLKEPFPIKLVPVLIVLAPIATGLSTLVAYLMYADLQMQLEDVLPSPGFGQDDPFMRAPLAAGGGGTFGDEGGGRSHPYGNAGHSSSRQSTPGFQAFSGTPHRL